jgi:hypothetical protein
MSAAEIAKSITDFLIPALGLAVIFWLIVRSVKWGYFKFRPAPKPMSIATTLLERFSHHLDECVKNSFEATPGSELSGPGASFIRAIKNSPPFLGLNLHQYDPVIDAETESKLWAFCTAAEFLEQNKDHIREGGYHRVRPGESLEDIARDQYGDVRYSIEIRKANPSGLSFTAGQSVWLPYIDISAPPQFSPDHILSAYRAADFELVRPTFACLQHDYQMTAQEAALIIGAVFDAAQRTRREQGVRTPLPKGQQERL